GGGRAEGQMDLEAALKMLRPVFADPAVLKLFHNVKYDLGLLARYEVEVRSFDDNLLMSYALDGPQFNTMGELSEHWLGHTGIAIKELLGTGKTARTFAQVPVEEAAKYAAEDADLTYRLWKVLKP